MMSFAFGGAGVMTLVVLAPIVQVVARKAAWHVSPVIIMAIAAVVSHLASVTFGILLIRPFQYWNAASIFAFGGMAYIFAFGAVYKSVSLEILLKLAERPDQQAPLAEIVEHQVPEVFRGRTKILVDSGHATCVDGSFVATTAGRKVAGRIAGLRRAFAIGDSGLYDLAD
jgi:hypothetical protein